MSKLLGKLMSIKFDGNELDIQSHNYSEEYTVIDVTDTATTGDSKETAVGRATRELQIDGVLKSSGAAVLGKNMNVNIGGTDYKVTDLNYEVNFDEIDTTDTGTAGDGTEFQAGFAERKSDFALWIQDTVASIPRGSALATTLTIASGITIAGQFRPESMKNEGEVKGSQKQTIAGTWQGAVTETPTDIGGVPMAVEKSCEIIYKSGGTSDKKLTGTATVFAKKISGNVNGEVKLSLTFKFTGTVTETQYAA